MAGFDIAPAGTADLADVVRLFNAYANELPVDLGAQGWVEELADLPGRYAPPRGVILLARDASGAPLGCVALRPVDASACELKRLYVSPAARGLGLGRALVARVIEEARRMGYAEVKLDTLAHMREAIGLYRSFGFAPIAPYGTYPYDGLVCLGRTLAPA